MQADAPSGVAGDTRGDGESPRAVVPLTTAEKLRNLADWLDAHPDAVVHNVGLIEAVHGGGPAKATSYACYSVEEMRECARGLGGAWVFEAGETAFTLSRDIAPGVRFEFFLSRAKVETEDAAA